MLALIIFSLTIHGAERQLKRPSENRESLISKKPKIDPLIIDANEIPGLEDEDTESYEAEIPVRHFPMPILLDQYGEMVDSESLTLSVLLPKQMLTIKLGSSSYYNQFIKAGKKIRDWTATFIITQPCSDSELPVHDPTAQKFIEKSNTFTQRFGNWNIKRKDPTEYEKQCLVYSFSLLVNASKKVYKKCQHSRQEIRASEDDEEIVITHTNLSPIPDGEQYPVLKARKAYLTIEIEEAI